MRTPQIGHIVLYQMPGVGVPAQYPALIIEASEEIEPKLTIAVFSPGGMFTLFGVPQGMEPKTWQWPDIPIN